MTEPHHEGPPVGEEVHLPGPTLIPLTAAVAVMLIVIGTTLSLIISAVGLVLLVVTVIRWVRETRRDVAELPEQHP